MSLFDALESRVPGLRIAALTIRLDGRQRCTLCDEPFASVDGWAPVESLYAGNEQLAITCAHCMLALRKTEHAR